jgi:hypothetical protein
LVDPLVSAARYALPVLERLQMRRRWMWIFNTIRGYTYWRGVREVFGSYRAVREYQASLPPLPCNRLDITHGLQKDLSGMWVDGPFIVEIFLEGRRLDELVVEGPLFGPLHSYLASVLLDRFEPHQGDLLREIGHPLATQFPGTAGVPKDSWKGGRRA